MEVELKAIQKWPFEPVRLASRKHLTWKTVFLVAIASARRASKLHALRHTPPYIRFSAEGVTLFPDVSFLPKVSTPFHTSKPISLPSLEREPMSLDSSVYGSVVCDLWGPFPRFGGLKQRILAWLVELILFVYKNASLPVPQGVKGLQTR